MELAYILLSPRCPSGPQTTQSWRAFQQSDGHTQLSIMIGLDIEAGIRDLVEYGDLSTTQNGPGEPR